MPQLEKYIHIQACPPESFNIDTLRTIWIAKQSGIRAIAGRSLDKSKATVQSYLFDSSTWDLDKAREWVLKHKPHSHSELLINNHTIVTASAVLCSSLPNLALGTADVKRLDLTKKKKSKGGITNEKYYFYVESVHEGTNLNGDHFFGDELAKAYKSMSYQFVDWEHRTEQIIGVSLDSQLVAQPEQPMAIGFNGIINRLSPYMGYDVDYGATRDEIIRQRYFEDKLCMSMECFFSSMSCTACGYSTEDVFDFEHHVFSMHADMIAMGERPGRGLRGVTFVGNGLVEFPADQQADVLSLRTADDGTLGDIMETAKVDGADSIRDKYGVLADPIIEARVVAFYSTPHDILTEDNGTMIFASVKKKDDDEDDEEEETLKRRKKHMDEESEKKDKKDKKKDEKTTKCDVKDDKEIEQVSSPDNPNPGGTIMFELITKATDAKSLSDVFNISTQAYKEYLDSLVKENMTEEEIATANTKKEEAIKQFPVELAEVISAKLAEKEFELGPNYTLTVEMANKIAEDTVAKAIEEKQAELSEKLKETEVKVSTLTEENAALINKVAESEKQVKSLLEAEANKQVETKVDSVLSEIKESGVNLTEGMEKHLRNLIKANISDPSFIEGVRADLIATVKQSQLIEGSRIMGDKSIGGNPPNGNGDLGTKLTEIKQKYTKKNS